MQQGPSAGARPLLGVVVVNFGSHTLLEENLAGLDLDAIPARAVVVDNFHSVSERAAVRALAAREGWELVAPEHNGGFGHGSNLGAAAAFGLGCTAVLLLNPDVVLEAATAAALLADTVHHPQAMISPTIVRPDGRVWFSGGRVWARTGDLTATAGPELDPRWGWLTAACLAVPREAWELTGGFDDRYFMYWEDVDLSRRLLDAGGGLLVRADLRVVHDVGATQGTGKSALYYSSNCRNRLLYAATHLPRHDRLRWAVATPRSSWRILLRGGRRQLVRSSVPLRAAVAGSAAGLLELLRTPPPQRQAPDAVRVYESIRTAHLERFRRMTPATVLFHRRRYDFDEELLSADGTAPQQVDRLGAVVALLRTPYRAVELNEPLMSGRWLDLAMQIAAVRLRGAVLREPRAVVGAYCIGLTDPAPDIAARRRVPAPVARAITRFALSVLVRGFDRLAFGTRGCYDLMAEHVDPTTLAARSRIFEALPTPCTCDESSGTRDPGLVLFVGAFTERKGVEELVRAWELLAGDGTNGGPRLHLVGKGPLAERVCAWADGRPDATVDIDPPRSAVHAAQRRAQVVVLLSKRVGAWREQVGLPIVEGLSHGCEVVASAETGLAGWLRSHGHRVVVDIGDAPAVAGAVRAALDGARPAEEILAALPDSDSRADADRWLLGPRDGA